MHNPYFSKQWFTKKCKYGLLFACILVFGLFNLKAFSITPTNLSPDSTHLGPYEIISAEYHLPATLDPEILPDKMTEIWGKIFYPRRITPTSIKAPLILMLHGNHATCGTGSNPRKDDHCGYTHSGVCPAGYIITPNHEGYNYLAENLASWGYIVVSINANRGINCGGGYAGDWGLNLARGKLVLKHLSFLHQWATQGSAPSSLGLGSEGLVGKIDFSAVGLFGHSRGGEGMRAAYNLYLDPDSSWPTKIPGLVIQAIFEIGAVDGQTARILDANGTVWNQLLPMCDGDVDDLQGRYPFERMLLNFKEPAGAQKSLYEVWGANHNYFNTEWQLSDTYGCAIGKEIFNPNDIGSEQQKKIALASVPAFFRSHVGSNANPLLNQNFNPLNELPKVVTDITQVDRDFTPSPRSTEMLVVEDFDNETGMNSSGNLNLSSELNIEHKYLILTHQHPQRVADISWKTAGKSTYFEAIWAHVPPGHDIHDFATLDFRVGRKIGPYPINSPSNFSIQLEDATGQFSKEISVSDYASIDGPGHGFDPLMKTVRIPLAAFEKVDLTNIRGVKFTFNKTESGTLYLANIRMHRQIGLGNTKPITFPSTLSPLNNIKLKEKKLPEYISFAHNSIRVIHPVAKNQLGTMPNIVEIVLASQIPFPVMDRLPVLNIGSKKFILSRYSDNSLNEMTFTLSAEQYKSLIKNSEITLFNGKIWQFGRFKR